MREFDLVSVDWDTVGLMQAGQWKQETFYLEELMRWTLQRGRFHGLLHLSDDGVSRPSPEGYQTFSVSVHGCFAIGANGYFYEVPDDIRLAVRGHIQAVQNVVPLFLGVGKAERLREPELHPSVDMGLLQCGGRRREYILASDSADPRYEWLQIAQFEKTPEGLKPDAHYIPDTMFLSSHANQWQMHKNIVELASQGLDALQKHSADNLRVFSVALTLAGSLGPAAVSVDTRVHPQAYVERLAGILAAQRTQLMALPDPGLTSYQVAVDDLGGFLTLMNGDWTMGQALERAHGCFERLLQLYPPLLKWLDAPDEEPEPITLGHDLAVSVPSSEANGQKPRSFWRK